MMCQLVLKIDKKEERNKYEILIRCVNQCMNETETDRNIYMYILAIIDILDVLDILDIHDVFDIIDILAYT